jgi:hypothetical protein
MVDCTAKPVIFISYSHKDEPDHPRPGEVKWLTYVQSFLAPKVKDGVFEIWIDEDIPGGAAWKEEIKQKLARCDLLILLVSPNSLESHFVINVEIATIQKRQQAEELPIYPIVLTPFTNGPRWLMDLNLTPRHGVPLSAFGPDDRDAAMESIATEIAVNVAQIEKQKGRGRQSGSPVVPAFVQTTRLPETGYERLVGRVAKLRHIDNAWVAQGINILSLIGEGGAGKSALVNEWLKRLQADNYRGAEVVLGWSFYSQGTKERATSADEFLNWTVDKLGINLETNSAGAKGEAIAEEMVKRRVLLVLDGVEPLQHGLDTQVGQLKDLGLRALLRHFASTPPGELHGLIVLTSRLAIKDISRWRDGSAPVIDLEQLPDDAGAALLRDNGVWGTEKELRSAAHDFGGHPLALGLLASFLTETQIGDVRRRDHIRAYFAEPDNPGHDHAKRVMESYEKEWLAGQPALLTIMHMVGLFDRPASGDCLKALRAEPIIRALTDGITSLSDSDWQRAVSRLRAGRLLAPLDLAAPDAIDAHPLVREWFGERLRQAQEGAWKAAHGRLYEHLRDTTNEGEKPKLEDLAPLYQAVTHGCRASRHQEALDRVYLERICRLRADGHPALYTVKVLGTGAEDLAAISWFFEKAYVKPTESLTPAAKSWVLSTASFLLRGQARLGETLSTYNAALHMAQETGDQLNVAIYSSNLSETELFYGNVIEAVRRGKESVDAASNFTQNVINHTTYAEALQAVGLHHDAERAFDEAQRRLHFLGQFYGQSAAFSSVPGVRYCNLMLDKGSSWGVHFISAWSLAKHGIEIASADGFLLDTALFKTVLGRANHGLAFWRKNERHPGSLVSESVQNSRSCIEDGIGLLPEANQVQFVPYGFLARAAFRRSVGDWDGVARDLDEVEEIAESGPMRLYLCDMTLERARLAFAKTEAFAPLNGMLEKDNPPKPALPSIEQIAELKSEAEKQIKIAAEYIEKCGYHRRDEELTELQAVLRGEKKFADLPPRV